MELNELAEKFSALRAKRKEREKVIDQMKELEEKMMGMIINAMSVQGMKTINFEGVGRFETGSRDHVEIRDKEKLARFVVMQAASALKNGGPVSDATAVFQQRAALGTITSLIEQGYDPVNMGVEVVEKPTLKFTKA
jgi:hypothetical protein